MKEVVNGFRPPRSRSLAARVGRAIILWCFVATLATTAIGYLVVSARIDRQVVTTLTNFIRQRGEAESMIFQSAQSNLDIFGKRFLQAYRDPAAFQADDFDTYFFTDDDGAIRLRELYFRGIRGPNGTIHSGLSGFIGRKRGPLTPDFKRRLVISYHLLAQFGPAWTGQFANLHASYPENALMMYWPQQAWGLEADAGLDMTDGAVIRATLQAENPRRLPVWSGLYYDLTAKKWAVTYQRPIDDGGRHLVTPSHDIFLDGLIDRLGSGVPAGARSLIISREGNLVAWANRMDDILKHEGVLHVSKLKERRLLAIYELLSGAGDIGSGRVLKSDELDAYIAVTRINGPDWWYITIYPYPLIAEGVRSTVGVMVAIGLLLSALLTAIVLLVLRIRVSQPMRQMKFAAQAVARGEYGSIVRGDTPLPGGEDEVGVLARAFRDMAERVEDQNRKLERTVVERTQELERAKSELEDLLREREALHHRYQQAVGFVAMVEGPSHRFTFSNRAFETFVGRTDMVGRTIAEVLPDLAGERLFAALDHVYARNEATTVDAVAVRVKTTDGGYKQVFVDTICQPIRNAAGEVIGVFLEGRDVTDQRQTQEKIVTLQAQLIHLSRISAMGTMGTMLAHELNQPLAALANYAAALRKLLARGQPDARLDEVADAIGRSAIRAGEIIRSLRRITRREEARRTRSDLKKLVDGACSLALLDAPPGASIEALVDQEVEFDADPVQIQQVLLNLIRNGFDATEGKAERKVRIVATRQDEGVVICVEDEGPGIAPEAFPQLFNSFFSTKASGMGIGLSICRTIVESHAGTIWAENRAAGGAAFCFKLPGSIAD